MILALILALILFIAGALLGEFVGQLGFYRFKFGWKTILPAVLLGAVCIPIVNAIGEITSLPLPPGTFTGAFLVVLLTRMYNSKDLFIEKHKDTNFRPETKSLESQNTAKSGGLSLSKVSNNSMSSEGRSATLGTGGGEITRQDGPTPSDLVNATDDDLWGIAQVEIENKKQKKGLWARLFYESDGDETKTKVAYLKERVDELKAARARSKKPIKAEATAPSAPPEEVKEEL